MKHVGLSTILTYATRVARSWRCGVVRLEAGANPLFFLVFSFFYGYSHAAFTMARGPALGREEHKCDAYACVLYSPDHSLPLSCYLHATFCLLSN